MCKRLFWILIVIFALCQNIWAEVVTHSQASVLRSGNWHKIEVVQTGVHLLSNDMLRQMGFGNASKVAIFGAGGAQLPFYNAASRPDDLVQIPTLQTSEGLLFYAENTLSWSYNVNNNRFDASQHQSAESNFYYVTDSYSALNITNQELSSATATNQYSTYTTRIHYEHNDVSVSSSGQLMCGEKLLSSNKSLTIDLGLPRRSSASDIIKLNISFVVCSSEACSYSISFNDVVVANGTAAALGSDDIGKQIIQSVSFKSNNVADSKLKLTIDLSAANTAYLDYITATSTSALSITDNNQLLFRQEDSYLSTNEASVYALNSPADVVVWDVSDALHPTNIKLSKSGTTSSFTTQNVVGTEYVAFSLANTSFFSPKYIGTVPNQNLHAQQPVNHIIVAHPIFMEQAERLANLHRQHSGLSVAVVSTEQIYNEFSSGKVDVSAIRDYIKMVFDRDRNKLRTVLLFGDGLYDNLHEAVGNKVPTYQSKMSLNNVQTYVTDDFFGWLDDNEGISDLAARMDVGVGRFPCQTAEEATVLVDKVETYLTDLDEGSWKTRIAFFADDENSNEHLINAENLAVKMEAMHPEMNYKRIYLEAYQYTPRGNITFYPSARADVLDQMNNGSLIINYVGHGGNDRLTADGVFKQSDIPTLTNKKRPLFLITAACSFGPFDHTNTSRSAGEEGLLYNNGGFIGCFTTTRTVYSNSNYQINNALYDYLLEKDENGRRYSIGEAVRLAKNKAGGIINTLKYVLLGDPAIVLCTNEQTVVTDSINGEAKLTCDEPLKALALSSIAGSVRKTDGTVDESFNGTVEIVLYDKKVTTKTTGIKSAVYAYDEYKNILYKGKTEVTNGHFTTQLRLSKDINFSLGYGRIFYYAVSDDQKEANGAEDDILIGGVDANAPIDTIGPQIEAWIDFDNFTVGQTSTGSAPVLYATFFDESGINTSGIGIGHDITICINNDRNNPISLNNYFSYNKGSITTGTVQYQLADLADGLNNITLKAWDIYNNSSELSVNVKSNAQSKIRFSDTKIYPSPFSAANGKLWLSFVHNDAGAMLNTTIEIFSIDGHKCISEKMTIIANAIQTEAIDITALAPEIICMPQGLYIVRVVVESSSGRSGSFCKHLLITN